jgi:hypothetical protein
MRAFERSLAQGMAVNGNGLGAVPMWLRASGVVLGAFRFNSSSTRCAAKFHSRGRLCHTSGGGFGRFRLTHRRTNGKFRDSLQGEKVRCERSLTKEASSS